MHFDLRSLRHIVALGRALSYTKAAKDVGLSQPALTRSIQAIEERTKVRLFDRDRGGVHLTAVGRNFIDGAAALLEEAKALEELLLRSADADAGDVAFGLAPLPASALLASAVTGVWQSKPNLILRAAVRPADVLLSLLLAEEIEFFVCAEGQISTTSPLISTFLGVLPMAIVVRAGHPLLAGDRNDLPHGFPLVSSGQYPNLSRVPLWVHPYVFGGGHLVEDYGVIKQLVQTTDAVWFTAPATVARELAEGLLVEVPAPVAEPVIHTRIVLYQLDRRSLSPASEFLKSTFETLIAEVGRSHQ